jgi:hypothetical protein
MTLLGVVDNLNHRIESLDSSSSNDQEGIEERGSGDTGNPEVDGLSNQLAEIENVDYTLEKTLTSMKIDLERIQAGWRGTLVCPSYIFPSCSCSRVTITARYLPFRQYEADLVGNE